MRRQTAVLAPLIMLAAIVFAAACGGSDNNSPSATATLGPGQTPAVALSTPAPQSGDALTTVEIVRKLAPSVVQVMTQDSARNVFNEAVPTRGIGTGVIIDEHGHIVTNNHVVRVAGEPSGAISADITITFSDGRTTKGTVVGTDPATDLAVIKIDETGLTPAELGDVASLPVGSDVVAMGYALGLEGAPTITRGVVSAKNRTINEDPFSIEAIQTDASINPGNSGGPLVDDRGRVIGINTAIIPDAQNIGFSISIDLVRPIAQELIANGEVTRGFLGVGFADLTPGSAGRLDAPVETGVVVTNIVAGSPAEDAGLQVDDIIVRLDGEEINDSGDLLEALRIHKSGEEVTISYYRGQTQHEAQLTLGERPNIATG
ncbi:MAG: trypsin-like peptidase domain-containing protein [Dehalococcoidia bacterium]